MSCEGLIKRLGYECHEIAESILLIATPFLFPDGEPIHFYLDENEERVTVHDNADTLTHLIGMGWDLSDRKKWKTIKNTVSGFGFELEDSGAIVGRDIQSLEQKIIAQYIGAMLAVVGIEQEHLSLSDEQITFVEEVEMYLKESKPSAPITHRPVIIGHSGRTHEFHFEFDGSLIDVTKPRSQSTGAILRRAADVNNAGNKKKILVVIDDRDDKERAKVEIDILNNMVSVMPFTTLAGPSTMSPTRH